MSTKRQPQVNEESYEALQTLFVKIARGGAELPQSDDVWRQALGDPWFRAEVRMQAARLTGGDVGDPLCDDISQQVVVQLKAKLSAHCGLGADAVLLRESCAGWLGRIIKRCCIDTIRRERRHAHVALNDTHTSESRVPQEDLRLDMAEAINQLECREREVAQLKLRQFTIGETAEALEMSERQIQCSLKNIGKALRRLLAVYLDDL